MLTYVGTCATIFDDNGNCLVDAFTDSSDFALVDCESEVVTEDLLKFVTLPSNFRIPNKPIYLYHRDRNIFFIYDDEKDIHYIFA